MEKETAILMADLSGYTAMTDVHGGPSAAQVVNRFMDLVYKSLAGDSRLVQQIGDQVVILSDRADDLVDTVRKLSEDILIQQNFLCIHAGLHFGPLHYQGGNFFGSTINVASRIMGLAKRSEILCSAAFFNALTVNSHSFVPVGKFKFKNVLKEVEIFQALNLIAHSSPVDPVCHMHIAVETGITARWKNVTYHFCSEQCHHIFQNDPEAFSSHPQNS